MQVNVCTCCDHGQIYCPNECSSRRRQESIRNAGARYQESPKGKLKHADRQQRYRDRLRQNVTHQGSAETYPLPTQEVEEVEAERVAPTAMDAVAPGGETSDKAEPEAVAPLDDAPMPEFAPAGPVGPAFSLCVERMGEYRCTFCGRLCGRFRRRTFLHGRSYGFS
jgi:hypothetical protein